MISFIATLSECSLMENKLYTYSEAYNCLLAPRLTRQVLDQNKFALSEFLQLYAFKDLSAQDWPFVKGVNIDALLLAVYDKYDAKLKGGEQPPAFQYFEDLQSCFAPLYDPHTKFFKPFVFTTFSQVLPFQFYYQELEKKWHLRDPDSNSSLQQYATQFKSYYQQKSGSPLKLNQSEEIVTINGRTPFDHFQHVADRTNFNSKSPHVRLNSAIGSYTAINLGYNQILEDADRQWVVEFKLADGSTYKQTLEYLLATTLRLTSVADMMDYFTKDLRDVPIYDDPQQLAGARLTHPMNVQYPIVPTFVWNTSSKSLKTLISSPNFFALYQSLTDEYIIQIPSFSPSNLTIAINDSLALFNIVQKLPASAKIYIFLQQNTGGYISLGMLLYKILFGTEYPFNARYTVRNSDLLQILAKDASSATDTKFFDWITGAKMNVTQALTRDLQYKMTNEFSFDVAVDEFEAVFNSVYNSSTSFDPSNVVLVTDGMCGSTCAVFLKHIRQAKRAVIYAIGGTNSTEKYESASFTGGMVAQTVNIEVGILELLNSTKLTSAEKTRLRSIYMGHGNLSFAYYAAHNFQPEQQISDPMEFVIVEPDVRFNEIMSGYDMRTATGAARVLGQIKQALKPKYWGQECKTENNTVYRSYQATDGTVTCASFGCSSGFYKQQLNQQQWCQLRSDPFVWKFIKPQEQIDWEARNRLALGLSLGIGIPVVFVVAFVIVIRLKKKKRWTKGKGKEVKMYTGE